MQLAYVMYAPETAKADVTPVILIHGLIETKATWMHIAPQIANITKRKVYAIDCRNHGDSPWVDDYSSDLLAADLADFIEQHKMTKVILVGHSMGGMVAMKYTLKQPNKVEKLVIEDSPAKKSEHRKSNLVPIAINIIKEITAAIPKGSDKEEAKAYLMDNLRNMLPLLKVSDAALKKYDWDALPIKWNGKSFTFHLNMDKIGEAVMKDTLVQDLSGTYEGETLCIYGSKSQFKVDEDILIAKHFPKATKVAFEDAGHFIHHEYVSDFVEKVSTFINGPALQLAAKL